MIELRWVKRTRAIDRDTAETVSVLQYRVPSAYMAADGHIAYTWTMKDGRITLAWGDWLDVPTAQPEGEKPA